MNAQLLSILIFGNGSLKPVQYSCLSYSKGKELDIYIFLLRVFLFQREFMSLHHN